VGPGGELLLESCRLICHREDVEVILARTLQVTALQLHVGHGNGVGGLAQEGVDRLEARVCLWEVALHISLMALLAHARSELRGGRLARGAHERGADHSGELCRPHAPERVACLAALAHEDVRLAWRHTRIAIQGSVKLSEDELHKGKAAGLELHVEHGEEGRRFALDGIG